VIAAQEDRQLHVLLDVGRAGFELLDVDVQGREEVVGQELRLDLVLGAAVVDRRHRVWGRGVGGGLRLDVPVLVLEAEHPGAGRAGGGGAVEHRYRTALPRRPRRGPGVAGRAGALRAGGGGLRGPAGQPGDGSTAAAVAAGGGGRGERLVDDDDAPDDEGDDD